MKINELKVSKSRNSNRVGRGISAGQGKTAGRGTKGQGARKSGGTRPGFEGGQMPLYMRIPKLRGFKSHRAPIEQVYTSQINESKDAIVTNKTLADAGLITSAFTHVKVVLNGDMTSKKTVQLQRASKTAKAAIEKAGGKFEVTPRQARAPKKKTEDK